MALSPASWPQWRSNFEEKNHGEHKKDIGGAGAGSVAVCRDSVGVGDYSTLEKRQAAFPIASAR